MTMRLLLTSAILSGVLMIAAAADRSDAAKAKQALQEVGDFVGQWNLTGEMKTAGRNTSWKETASWGWKFKGDDAWLRAEIKDGKYITRGDLKYLPDKKVYQFTATAADGTEQIFMGESRRGRLVLERTDAATGDVHRLTMNTLSEGVRFVLQYEVQQGGKGLFATVYRVAGTKEGETFAGGRGTQRPDCIVTGGAGTIPVSYMGKTYYVCCSGCKEEFEENPKKYVDAFENKK
jgi:hypothetical protein